MPPFRKLIFGARSFDEQHQWNPNRDRYDEYGDDLRFSSLHENQSFDGPTELNFSKIEMNNKDLKSIEDAD